MVCLHTSIPPIDPKLARAKSKISTAHFSKLRQINRLDKKRNMPPSDCEQSHSVIIDVVILIAVVGASGVLLYPYINLVVHILIEFFEEVSDVVKEEFLRAPMVFICLGLSIFFAVIALLAVTVCTTGRGCGRPGCRRLKKAAEFDIQLETEDSLKKSNLIPKTGGVKKGIFKLPRDYHQELESELKRMAPPNGRAVLVYRGRCGCSIGTMEIPGPRKTGKFKK
ncbi:hypothetical protein R3W88_006961 [Solanum pinnatisectum]|uniref:60S ribosomal protein L34 n=1 Tax=Solanum pinnatisectum TaxID=50273 RepID=A0AAV9KG92_9SOLN|nr:hypothetical protein R3W88_006961 [Solanum pinnatisectum]